MLCMETGEIRNSNGKISPNKLVSQIRKSTLDLPLDQKLELAAHMFIERAIDVSDEMSGKDAMIAAGISIEKMQLLRGLPTEIAGSVSILVKIGEAAADEGIPLKQVLTALLESMNEARNSGPKRSIPANT